MPFFITHYTSLICDDCGKIEKISSSYPRDARKLGWSISRDYRKCYCPKCTSIRKYPKQIDKWIK